MSAGMLLSELLPDVAQVPPGLRIGGLVQDSRAVRPGDAFVAIGPVDNSPSVHHGLGYVEQARARGAAAILFEPPAPESLPAPTDAIAVPGLRTRLGALADRFHGQPSRHMTMVGVTGTNGKTSTVQLLVQAWQLRGVRAGSIGTLGAGLYGQVRPTGFTTPLVLQLHALLAELRAQGAQAVAMEVSSHALAQTRVDGVHFEVAVFTNLTRDHLDYHGTMEAYGEAKARLLQWPELKAAVVNLDDAFGATLPSRLAAGVEAIGTSSRGHADARVRASNAVLDAAGIAFDLEIDGEVHALHSPLLGRVNIDNLLAVAGVLRALGDAPATIAAVLAQLQPIPGRMNRLGGDAGRPLVVVDYAHTPDALDKALQSLREHTAGRLLCVFGCGGERDRGKRPQMAAIAERLADTVVVTDDNPRGEDGDAIVADILAGFADPAAVTVQRERARAIAAAVAQAGAGDTVLIAGKGHEPYQEIAGVRHAFDDSVQARAALEARR
ncbi:MAG: UDP-N-acetylmuramoyl-L-alanyl-D-glutamate--2,6-diaminopimelate ligase [Pseudoxanthomonas sp.]